MNELIALLRERQKDREDLVRAETRLTNQVKAICRRLVVPPDHKGALTPQLLRQAKALYKQMDRPYEDRYAVVANTAAAPLLQARALIHSHRLTTEKSLVRLAEQLPVFPWWVRVDGLGALGLAQLVGEAGDLSRYAGPAKLWVRMGVGMKGGQAQRRMKDKEAAKRMQYAPRRRSAMWRIGSSLIKKQNEYRDLYLARKQYEEEFHPELTKGHRHKRAQRYMEKRLLRNLWRAWRQAGTAT